MTLERLVDRSDTRPTMANVDLPEALLISPTPIVESASSATRHLSIYGRSLHTISFDVLASLESLWVSGLSPKDSSVVGRLRGLRKLVVHGPTTGDLRWLSELRDLRALGLAGRARLGGLAGIEALSALEDLSIFGIGTYRDLSPLGALGNLRSLAIEGGVSKSVRVDSLRPVAKLVALERLRLACIRVEDDSLPALATLVNLRDVFVSMEFSEPNRAQLARALPLARGDYLDQAPA